MKKIDSYKAILFDLGQVIVDVDFDKTFQAFSQIKGALHNEIQRIFKHEEYFLYERGALDDQQFFSHINAVCYANLASYLELTTAWKAMISSIPTEKIDFLRMLRDKTRLYALSNTNNMHVEAINAHLLHCHQIDTIHDLFDKVYLSQEIKMIKPDPNIFKYVLAEQQLQPHQVLFIDDNHDNIKSAIQLGFHTLHLKNRDDLIPALNKMLNIE